MKKVFVHFHYFSSETKVHPTKDDFVLIDFQGKLDTDEEMDTVRNEGKRIAEGRYPGHTILVTGVTRTW